MMTPWKKMKLLKMFAESFGKEPDKEYFPGDMGFIRTFYDACLGEESDQFHVDETTWKDLNMEAPAPAAGKAEKAAGVAWVSGVLHRPLNLAGGAFLFLANCNSFQNNRI